MRGQSMSHTLVFGASLLLMPAACAQTDPPTTPPGQTPEAPKGDVGEAAEIAQIVEDIARDEALESLMASLDKADHDTRTLRAGLRHVSENFVTGLTETRDGTLTLKTTREDDRPALRQFRVDFDQLIVDRRISEKNTAYIFDGVWLAEKITDEKQFNKWQVVRPGERADPMDKLTGSGMWLPLGQDTQKLRDRYHASIVLPEEYFNGETMGGLIRGTVMPNPDTTPPQVGSVQLRLIPRDKENDPVEEIRMWFDEESFLPRAHAVLDGEGIQIVALFNVKQNPGDVDDELFDTTTPPAAEGWDATIRELRERAGP